MTETIPVITSFIHDLLLQLRLLQPHTITDDDIDDDLPDGDDPYRHTPCHVCRRQDQEDTMLLCDDCDRGYHLHCLSPPLPSLGENGDATTAQANLRFIPESSHYRLSRPVRIPSPILDLDPD